MPCAIRGHSSPGQALPLPNGLITMPSTPSLQHDRCIMHGPSTGAQRMRAVPLACLAALLAACSGNVRDPAPAGLAAHPVPPIAVPDVAHPQGETAAWWEIGRASCRERV